MPNEYKRKPNVSRGQWSEEKQSFKSSNQEKMALKVQQVIESWENFVLAYNKECRDRRKWFHVPCSPYGDKICVDCVKWGTQGRTRRGIPPLSSRKEMCDPMRSSSVRVVSSETVCGARDVQSERELAYVCGSTGARNEL
ncbi:hypothetical protein ANN_01356 [Periplaneta americana]|uniref:Uncharacterized protein n=1 Tax=Periplaneta americana TaxID=6978 RepID=A0ABQ8TTC7_PERAM|nr:hypothetical protein ANN_01356 [Periplaneta americana]